MNWHEAGEVAGPVLTLIGVLLAPELGRRAGRKTVDAALQQAEAAKVEAEAAKLEAEAAKDEAAAEMRKAVAAERESASADWARYCDAKDREIISLRERVERNDERLGQAEMRALADRERAERSDRLYWKAVIYLRIVIRWINDEHPGETYPPPPAELVADL